MKCCSTGWKPRIGKPVYRISLQSSCFYKTGADKTETHQKHTGHRNSQGQDPSCLQLHLITKAISQTYVLSSCQERGGLPAAFSLLSTQVRSPLSLQLLFKERFARSTQGTETAEQLGTGSFCTPVLKSVPQPSIPKCT